MSNRLRFRFDAEGGGTPINAPGNTVAPAITGNAWVGQTLTCSTGTWTNFPTSYSYQWKADAGNVGTNQNTYVPQAGDVGKVITCVVTATNTAGSTPATSNATAAVITVPANTVLPAITGNAYVGSTLTSSTGTWSGGGSQTYAYQWKSAGSNVGTNQNTYVPQSSDLGNTITCTVTASNAAGTGSGAQSAATAAVIGTPVNTVIPAISGTAQVNQTLTSTTGTWTGGGSLSYSYQWKSAGSNVGSNQNTYVPVVGDIGNTITVTVTASNAAGTGTPAVSNATSAVVAAAGTLNPSDKSANITLSNGNLTAAKNGGASDALARSETSHTTGKYYYEAQFVAIGNFTAMGFGFANATSNLNSGVNTTNSAGLYQDGNATVNGNHGGATASFSAGQWGCAAIDLDARTVKFRKAGGSFTTDYALPAGMASGAIFAAVAVLTWVTGPDTFTVNFGASAFQDTIPVGYSPWG